MYKRILTFLLAVFCIGTMIAGCGSQETGPEQPASVTEATEPAEVTTADDGRDRVPAMDLNGAVFTVWSGVSDFYHGNLVVEEENGELFNDARYECVRSVEERFNVDITEITSAAVSTPKTAVLAGEDAYDMTNLYTSTAITWAQEGLTYILDDLPCVDTTRPYWNHAINEALSIRNKSYFAVAPFNLSVYDFAHAMLFNKGMIEDYNLQNPYKLVNDGKWTLDAYTEMTVAATKDVNGDSQYTGEDQYGFLAQPKAVLPGFWIASGESTIRKDADGTLYFAAIGNERFATLIERLFAITWDNNTWYQNQSTTNYDDLLRNMFKNNQGLLFDTQFFYIESLRDMETDFGIIPYPKYDEAQDQYYTRQETIYLFTVPVTNTELESTSALIEALACEAYYTVIPAYYDVSLKTKYTRDDESSAMLDILFDSLTIDYGDTVWCANIRDGIFRLMFLNNTRNLASDLASIEETVNTLLTDTMEAYAALE